MARWKTRGVKATPLKKPPKIGLNGAPKVNDLKKTPTGPQIRMDAQPSVGAGIARKFFPKPKTPKAPAGAPGAPSAWYDPKSTAARNAALVSALSDPLKPVTGADAVSYARALADSTVAPVMQDFDRQASLAESKASAQSQRSVAGNQALRALLAQQLAGQQATAGVARDRIAGAGAAQQAALTQGGADATNAATADAATRGAGLDGGAAAERAQELANARARGQAGTTIALDQQATNAQTGDAFLNQITAATGQQGEERLGAITAALSGQLRDVNEGRSKALASGEQTFLKAIMDLKSDNTQTALATKTLDFNSEKASADQALAIARLQNDRDMAAATRKFNAAQGAARIEAQKEIAQLQATGRDLDRQARLSTADANRSAADRRQDKALAARNSPAAKDKKLTSQDKERRVAIRNVDTLLNTGLPDASSPSQFRRKLETRGVKTILERQILADLKYGGLRPNTVKAYRAQYGRNPPSQWERYKKPKAKGGAAAGFAGAAGGTVGTG